MTSVSKDIKSNRDIDLDVKAYRDPIMLGKRLNALVSNSENRTRLIIVIPDGVAKLRSQYIALVEDELVGNDAMEIMLVSTVMRLIKRLAHA